MGYSSPQLVSNYERGISDIPIKRLREIAEICKADKKKIKNLLKE
ncbi:MAG: hypothetical protein ACPG5P_05735 [Saprospiraceae bacterium]